MRVIVEVEDMEKDRRAAWADGFGAGSAIGVGLALAACGAWAMLAGVWS
jgi:hypothetical protein